VEGIWRLQKYAAYCRGVIYIYSNYEFPPTGGRTPCVTNNISTLSTAVQLRCTHVHGYRSSMRYACAPCVTNSIWYTTKGCAAVLRCTCCAEHKDVPNYACAPCGVTPSAWCVITPGMHTIFWCTTTARYARCARLGWIKGLICYGTLAALALRSRSLAGRNYAAGAAMLARSSSQGCFFDMGIICYMAANRVPALSNCGVHSCIITTAHKRG